MILRRVMIFALFSLAAGLAPSLCGEAMPLTEYQRLLMEYESLGGQLSALQWQSATESQEAARVEEQLRQRKEALSEELTGLLTENAALEEKVSSLEEEAAMAASGLSVLAPEGLSALREELNALGAQWRRVRSWRMERQFLEGPDGVRREFRILILGESRRWILNAAAGLSGGGVWKEDSGTWEDSWDSTLVHSLESLFHQAERSRNPEDRGVREVPL